ncbi:MAG: GCN5-related N-acetyltransferase [Frankiales bacterium]|nr:GCN5-related N-acetyltransferase [Frankiales bacterium]
MRRVTTDDWRDLRTLRLEALADTPIGFLETLAAAEGEPDGAWQARAARGAVGGDAFQVMAWDGDRPVANCVSFLRDGAGWLAAVYVAPAYRGKGLLGELVEHCTGWARERAASVLRLEVHEDNARAQAAYRRMGFTETGARQPYDLDPSRDELLMERPL